MFLFESDDSWVIITFHSCQSLGASSPLLVFLKRAHSSEHSVMRIITIWARFCFLLASDGHTAHT